MDQFAKPCFPCIYPGCLYLRRKCAKCLQSGRALGRAEAGDSKDSATNVSRTYNHS